MSVPNWGLLIGFGGFVTSAGTSISEQLTDNLADQLGIGVTTGVAAMLLCAYTVDVVRAKRQHKEGR